MSLQGASPFGFDITPLLDLPKEKLDVAVISLSYERDQRAGRQGNELGPLTQRKIAISPTAASG
jgi:hypothetical protein